MVEGRTESHPARSGRSRTFVLRVILVVVLALVLVGAAVSQIKIPQRETRVRGPELGLLVSAAPDPGAWPCGAVRSDPPAVMRLTTAVKVNQISFCFNRDYYDPAHSDGRNERADLVTTVVRRTDSPAAATALDDWSASWATPDTQLRLLDKVLGTSCHPSSSYAPTLLVTTAANNVFVADPPRNPCSETLTGATATMETLRLLARA